MGLYDFAVRKAEGGTKSLSDYRGEVLLVVNVASKCGFTPQYEGLEKLHRHYRSLGFSVLGFPCNQFREQEPGDADEISRFCSLKYDVTFPIFAKLDVNGPQADPLFAWLKEQKAGLLGSRAIKWNFTKFLLDRHGRVVKRHAPITRPDAIGKEIAALL